MNSREELIKRLREAVSSDHARGCEGRQYACDCGHDLMIEGLLEMAADEIERNAVAQRPLPADDSKDDPSADERWNAGVDCVMKLLCDYLGVHPDAVTWDAATETVDGDISAVIGNILRVKFGEDWSPSTVTSTGGEAPAQPQQEPCPYAIDGCVLENQEIGPCLCALTSTDRAPLMFSGERDPLKSLVEWTEEVTAPVTSTERGGE